MNVERNVRDALSLTPDVQDTKFDYRSSVEAQITARSLSEAGAGLYFTLYTEGQPAATVESGGPNVERRHAPTGEEYLKTGLFMLLKGNHLAYVVHGHTNDGQLTSLIHKFFEHCGMDGNTTKFAFMPRADRREMEKLLRRGVKSIDLGLSSYSATGEEISTSVSREQSTPWSNAGKAVWESLISVLGSDRTADQIRAESEMQVRLYLNFDGRKPSKLTLQQILAEIGSSVVEDTDEFRIVTSDDEVITQDSLVIRRNIVVSGDEVALDPANTFKEMEGCLNLWEKSGLFEE